MEDTPATAAEEQQVEGRLERFRLLLARVETVYLEVLRAAALIVATLILFGIVWLLISSAYRLSRDADGVELAPVAVTAQQVVDIEDGDGEDTKTADAANDKGPSDFEAFRDKYFALYQSNFEKYLKDDDSKLSKDAFTDRFLVGFADQGEMMEDMTVEAAADIAESAAMADAMVDEYAFEPRFLRPDDYPDLLATMREASTLPLTIERLKKYADTPKVRSERKVRRTRQESYCEYYSDYFGECLTYGSRTVPYETTEVDMVMPEGVLDPKALFGAYQDSYISTLLREREKSSSEAAEERSARLEANAKGWLGLSNALWFAGAFLVLMFFFLLVAMERHQRRMAAQLQAAQVEQSSG
ncbi:hypothetical protein I5L01_03750 [Erythrobacter sp. YJ-T3-07]|uniref:hypothetical protein n=1 Tax=Erythrobacter sp. YJ-T3-07 TaxID=2793063 RepID=UPI0018D3255D|nr:hypothetical protein [Erythrobacter sp. YJ-T3-07]MBH1943340.1 hypothetical protein [Erythrobacter sp. YJ-T3-07]